MPELPEVETIRRTLIKCGILNNPIKSIVLKSSRLIRTPSRLTKQFRVQIIGEEFYQLERLGKYLFLIAKHCSLILHFGMSGVINWYPKNLAAKKKSTSTKHEYATLLFEDGSVLSFVDPRTFGKIIPCLVGFEKLENTNPTVNPPIYSSKKPIPACVLNHFHQYAQIGIDILATPTPKLVLICKKRFSQSKRVIKNVLLDQSVISGVGNIYADESLFKAKISPLRESHTLTTYEWNLLLTCVKATFRKAIASGGSSINDYRKPNGLSGNFQSKFLIYGKGGQTCSYCNGVFKQTVIQARTTTYCSNCQQ